MRLKAPNLGFMLHRIEGRYLFILEPLLKLQMERFLSYLYFSKETWTFLPWKNTWVLPVNTFWKGFQVYFLQKTFQRNGCEVLSEWTPFGCGSCWWVGELKIPNCLNLGFLWSFWNLMLKMWMFPKIVGFPPKSSNLIGFSIINIINYPFWGIPIFGNTHVNKNVHSQKSWVKWYNPQCWTGRPLKNDGTGRPSFPV